MKSDLCTEREKCNFSPPPVGIKPKWLHDEHRREEIIEGIIRFHDGKKQIPLEWILEYNELVSGIDAAKAFFRQRSNEINRDTASCSATTYKATKHEIHPVQ